MEVVFLKAKQRLVKEISAEGKKPYPLAKNFTSHHHKFDKTPEGFAEFFELLKKYSIQGAALYKGLLKKKLKIFMNKFKIKPVEFILHMPLLLP